MTGDDTRLADLFDRAISGPVAMRSTIVAEAEASDPDVARELALMLAAHDGAEDYFEALGRNVLTPALEAIGLDDSSGSELLNKLQDVVGQAYTIERELGGGGMSRVFLATETRLPRKVVIKVLPEGTSLGVSVDRFLREIKLSARLQHPHIVSVLTSDSAKGFLYYVMPYVEGESLRARISRDGALPPADSLAIWRDILDALGFAHQHGVVHRDVKPENILLSGRNALVADFGIAHAIEAAADEKGNVTGPGSTLGTPSYMAPEQMSGQNTIDQRVDIYTAGLVMYEMLTGRKPFAGLSQRDTAFAHVTQPPPAISRENVSPELAALVIRCLDKNPDARPQTADAIIRELDIGASVSAAKRPRRNVAQLAGATAILIAILVVGANFARRGASSADATATATARPSLVVLPLTNRSPDAADAGLADGMTEELISTLSRNPDLRVIASTSAFALKGTQHSVRQIADSLDVTNILEGNLQKIGSRLRMQVRLVDARNGSTRWSESYDREMTDLFAVQADISQAVARELDLQLGNASRSRPPQPRYTPNVAAYEWYLRGMDVSLMRSEAGTRKSLDYFNRAIEADSNFAAAYAGMVRPYLQLRNAGRGTDGRGRRDLVANAMAAALKAVALDDSLAEAHAALGWARLSARDLPGSESSFRKALSLNPDAPRLHEGMARLYMITQRPAEQLVTARLGLETDPFSHSAIREMALALMMNGRCDEALELLRPLKALSPPAGVAGIISGQCYAAKQMWPQAIAEYRWTIDSASGASGPAFLAHALARNGQVDEARKILSDLIAGRTNSHGAFGVAVAYAGFRDYDNAFAWLEKAVAEESITAYIVEPMFADLHRDPRFARIRSGMQRQKR